MIAFMDVLLAWGLEAWTSHRLHPIRYGRVDFEFQVVEIKLRICAIKQFWGLGFPFLGGQGSTGHTL